MIPLKIRFVNNNFNIFMYFYSFIFAIILPFPPFSPLFWLSQNQSSRPASVPHPLTGEGLFLRFAPAGAAKRQPLCGRVRIQSKVCLSLQETAAYAAMQQVLSYRAKKEALLLLPGSIKPLF